MKKQMLIAGQWQDGAETLEVKNKYTGAVLATVPRAGRGHVEQAMEAAKKTFIEKMAIMPAHQRSAILHRTSRLLEENKDELAAIIAAEAGKAWKYAALEVNRAAQTFQFAAEEAKRIHGETVPMDAAEGAENKFGFYLRCPVGVVVAISPFNFPLNLVAHKVAPAIAAANTLVLKPASATPLTAIRLGELLMQAGLPDGALNILFGSGATVGEWLVTDPCPAKISFTGSPVVGRRIMSVCGLKKVTMELGNNSGVIVDEDADIDFAVKRCVMGSFANSGQVCISVQRIYVHKSIFPAFVEKFVSATQALKTGDPLDKECDVGPMIDEGEAKRAMAWVEEARSQGARVLMGGTAIGAMMMPTVLVDVKPEMRVVCDEIFAPVVSIIPSNDMDEAIKSVDATDYGLQAGIFTKNLHHALAAVRGINAGGIIVNDVPTFRADHMPYGGNKHSGLGREGVRYAVEEMTNIKMVCMGV